MPPLFANCGLTLRFRASVRSREPRSDGGNRPLQFLAKQLIEEATCQS